MTIVLRKKDVLLSFTDLDVYLRKQMSNQ
jgi:hypothetical protein